MKSLHKYLFQALPFLISLMFMILLALLSDEIRDQFFYNFHLINKGEYWRLISGNFIHFNNAHLLMNMTGLVLAFLLVGKQFTGVHWGLLILFCALISSLSIYTFNSELMIYGGFSSVLHGIFLAGSIKGLKFFENKVLLVLLSSKLIYEQFIGPLPGSEDFIKTAVPVYSHLYGALSSLLYMLLIYLFKKSRLK